MKNINNKSFMRTCCLVFLLLVGCDTDELAAQSADVKSNERDLLVFHANGEFQWNGKKMWLGDSTSAWVKVLGSASRILESGTHIWDQFGLVTHVKMKNNNSYVIDLDLSFVDWEKYDPYLGGGDGLPTGYFKGIFQYGDAILDRDTSVKKFLSYKSTANFDNSHSRNTFYRTILEGDPPIGFGVNIRAGEKDPWLPKSVSIYRIE